MVPVDEPTKWLEMWKKSCSWACLLWGCRYAAEEIADKVLDELMAQHPGLPEEAEKKLWIRTRDRARDRRRADRRVAEKVVQPGDMDALPDAAEFDRPLVRLLNSELYKDIAACMDTLRPSHRSIIEHWNRLGFPKVPDLAKALGRKYEGLRSEYGEARRALRSCLQRKGHLPPVPPNLGPANGEEHG